VPVALVAGVFLARARRSVGIGNDLWAWAALAGGLLVVGAAYVDDPNNTAFWLLTSVHRTTMFPDVAAWLIVGTWMIVAISGIVPRARPVVTGPTRRVSRSSPPSGALYGDHPYRDAGRESSSTSDQGGFELHR